MKIAVLIHSAAKNDARVAKEAMSLRAAGHEVVIHGISPDLARHRLALPGSDVPLWLEPRVSAAARVRKRALLLLALAPVLLLAAASGQALVSRGLRFAGHDVASLVVMLGVLGGLGVAYASRHRLARFAQHLDDFVMTRHASSARARQALNKDAGLDLARGHHDIAAALLRSVASGPRPDAFHIHDLVALVLAASLKRRYAVPVVWDAHEIYQDLAGGDALRARENAAIIAGCHRQLDHFITINDSIARFYRDHYPALPTPVVVMNATVPEPVPVYDGCLHRAAGLPLTQKILLFQGRFSAHRGLQHLVEAAAALRADWTLVMMGWGGLEATLRAQAAQHVRAGTPATVFVPGVPQAQLQLWSAGATLGVVPYENTSLNHLYCTPNKLWEYPGAGVPMLCTDLPEMAAIVERFGCGALLPRDFTAADIARIVNGLDDEALARMRARCAPYIAANNWSHWENNLLGVYADIARAAGAR